MLHPQNRPDRETQIFQYLTVQVQSEILVGRAAAEALPCATQSSEPEVPIHRD